MRSDKQIFLVLAVVIGSCRPSPSRPKDAVSLKMDELIHRYRGNMDLDSLRAVMVITEEGCVPCSRAFSALVADHMDDPKVLFWVSAQGMSLDISTFKAHPGRVIWDDDHALQRSGILEGTGAIMLHDGEVDTVISVDANNLEAQLAYVTRSFEQDPDTTQKR